MKYSQNKELNKLIKKALNQDWRIKKGKNSAHTKLYSPDHKTIVIVSNSSVSRTGLLNVKNEFKKGGLNLS